MNERLQIPAADRVEAAIVSWYLGSHYAKRYQMKTIQWAIWLTLWRFSNKTMWQILTHLCRGDGLRFIVKAPRPPFSRN